MIHTFFHMQCPTDIHTLLKEVFYDGAAYGQLATVDTENVPSVRTVHFLIDAPLQNIIVNSHIDSQKWLNVAAGNAMVSGCYWSQEKSIQFRFKANAELLTAETGESKNLVEQMWSSMRPEVRTAYRLADQNIPLHRKNIDIDADEHSPKHGLLLCRPYLWDVFFESPQAYRFGTRQIFTCQADGSWQKKERSSLHEKDVLLYDQQP